MFSGDETSDVHEDSGTTYSNAATEIERFKTGDVKIVTDARLDETEYTYDDAWRRTSVEDEMGNKTTWNPGCEWEPDGLDG